MTVALAIENACFAYPGQPPVWENLNLQVLQGECLCLLGPNGCGKTTLFNCVGGSSRLDSGSILLHGKDIRTFSVTELAKTIGIVFQEHSAPFPYTALEVVRMGRNPHLPLFGMPAQEDTELAYSIMEDLGIAHLAGKSYTHISGGERQLVLIARTLCQQPRIILFDEPASHLDFRNQAMVLHTIQTLSQKGLTIIMTSHFPNHVWKVGSSAALLGGGRILAHGPLDAVMTEENLSRIYGLPVKIFTAQDEATGIEKLRFCDPVLKS